MKKGDKEKKSTSAGEKADNASVHSQPTVQQKTEQGEAETYDGGHEGHNQIPPKNQARRLLLA
ncbi:hypothetical protein GXP67_30125 [Rhodocytophaga rosea]|uniref:Uncharacterized protein n=1 Tax=Rhodocytophaga rosea TaxID=2704465 RepID=A0A6C0GRB8_9BACT|nr:hypothetical protein [Rhodocytophaga rosea]QHT70609.1 hypothetical protein GXP67_30125 [Rhodocytophaga rosea]